MGAFREALELKWTLLLICTAIFVLTANGQSEMCCEHEFNPCDFTCLNTSEGMLKCNNRTDRCLNTSVACFTGLSAQKFCSCVPLYAERKRDRCDQLHTMLGTTKVTFLSSHKANTVAHSKQKCTDTCLPLATISCQHNTTCGVGGRATFNMDTLFRFNCNDTITSVVDNALKGGTPGFDILTAASYLLQGLNSTTKQLNSSQLASLANFLAFAKQRAENQTLTVSTELLTKVASIANSLTGPVWEINNSSDERAVKNEQKKVITAVASLAQRVKLENTSSSFEFASEFLAIQVKDNYDLNAPATFVPGDAVRVSVPASALRQALEMSTHSNRTARAVRSVRSSFVFYKDGSLFYSTQRAPWVVSIDVGDSVKLVNLSEPIRIQSTQDFVAYGRSPLENSTLQALRHTSKCVYWDLTFGEWRSDGCCLNLTAETPECLCDHLTNFAVLVRSDLVAADVVLSLISDIGCILSMVGLLFTIVVHLIDRDVRQRRPVKIMIHLCANLLLFYLVFVAGIGRVEHKYACVLITALLHYLLLTTWCWMSVYSFDMYKSLVKVFSDRRRYFLQHCVSFAYGAPLVVVITTAAVAIGYFDQQNHKNSDLCDPSEASDVMESHYNADNMCWLHGSSLYIGLLAPVGILLSYNCWVFAVVTYELSCKKTDSHAPGLRRSTKQTLLIAVTMVTILGLAWASGYFLLISQNATYTTIISWVFALFCTLQGFLIFLLTSVRRSDMRKIWWSPIRSIARRSSTSASRSAPRKQSATSGLDAASKKHSNRGSV